MSDQKKRFLEAEEEASRLVSQMQDLKRSMESHKEASTSLQEATNSVTSLANKFAETSKLFSPLIAKLSEIGTPAILESIESKHSELAYTLRKSSSRVVLFISISIVIGLLNFMSLLVLAIILLRQLK